jgi:flagellar biosynthesis/type III secretory pathway M-ring protein FliF/YscJ
MADESTPQRPAPAADAPPRPYPGTPNAERYVIAADNLRRRQLKSALLHGSSRTWREQRRIWPGVIAGAVVVAVIVAAIAVAGAFRNERELQERQRQQQQTSHSEAIGHTT